MRRSTRQTLPAHEQSRSLAANSSNPQVTVTGSGKRKQYTPKKKKRSHILRDIRRLRGTTDLLIPRLPFARLLREVAMEIAGQSIRFSLLSIQAIQEAAEAYMVYFLQDAYACTLHRDRVTLGVKDMKLIRFLRGPTDPANF